MAHGARLNDIGPVEVVNGAVSNTGSCSSSTWLIEHKSATSTFCLHLEVRYYSPDPWSLRSISSLWGGMAAALSMPTLATPKEAKLADEGEDRLAINDPLEVAPGMSD